MTNLSLVKHQEETAIEDPLAHLPCSIIEKFRKGDIIYRQNEISTHLYLVIDGKVKFLRQAQNNLRPFLIDIYDADIFFGESSLIGLHHAESAVALEDTRLMTWTVEEIERLAASRPRLSIALMQLMIQRGRDFEKRIESLVVDTVDRRLAQSLLRFSERFGCRSADGTVKMIPFTHELLAQYVGSSREIVSAWMNHFRNQGYLQYSRMGMVIHADALRDWLNRLPAPRIAVRTAA